MRYKLLQALPGHMIGEVFDTQEGTELNTIFKGGFRFGTDWSNYSNYPDFFEPLPDKPTRWRAKRHEDYWYMDKLGRAVSLNELGGDLDLMHYNVGNYFRTQAQAQAVAEAYKKMLSYINNMDDWINTNWYKEGELERTIEKARKLVQEEQL